MKLSPRKCIIVLGMLLLAFLVLGLCWGFWPSAPARLSVTLVDVESEPGPAASGPTVLAGIKGLCAMFAVTNIGKDGSIWFDTCAIEQRIGSGWQRTAVEPYARRGYSATGGANPWHGMASDLLGTDFSPRMGWYIAVEWPRQVPTNESWRLQLQCGLDPSPKAKKWDNKLGVTFFARRRNGQTIYTPEVRQ
jgi:hypothetical protein